MKTLRNWWGKIKGSGDWDHKWPLKKKLDYMAKLEHDWDSYGGDPINPEAIETARRILSDKDTSEDYIVCPSGDGGIAVYWKSGGCEMHLEIEPDGGLFVTTIPPNRDNMMHFRFRLVDNV